MAWDENKAVESEALMVAQVSSFQSPSGINLCNNNNCQMTHRVCPVHVDLFMFIVNCMYNYHDMQKILIMTIVYSCVTIFRYHNTKFVCPHPLMHKLDIRPYYALGAFQVRNVVYSQ